MQKYFLGEEGQYEDNSFYPLYFQWASDCDDFDQLPCNNKRVACSSLLFKHNVEAVKPGMGEGLHSELYTL